MAKRIKYIILIITLLFFNKAYACFNSDGDTVEIVGEVTERVFPGPPNYASIEKGDKAETCWILNSKIPICVKGLESQSEFQLLLKQNNIKKPGIYKIIGNTFEAISGHHHTRILIEVISVSEP